MLMLPQVQTQFDPRGNLMFCKQCGNEIPDAAAICVKCGVPTTGTAAPRNVIAPTASGAKSRIAYILLGVFLGALGIHNFYAGYSNKAIAQLLISLLTGWLIVPLIGVWIWVLVEICTVTTDSKGVAFE
jgi:TM2 domain-containing membrane protein YozV